MAKIKSSRGENLPRWIRSGAGTHVIPVGRATRVPDGGVKALCGKVIEGPHLALKGEAGKRPVAACMTCARAVGFSR